MINDSVTYKIKIVGVKIEYRSNKIRREIPEKQ